MGISEGMDEADGSPIEPLLTCVCYARVCVDVWLAWCRYGFRPFESQIASAGTSLRRVLDHSVRVHGPMYSRLLLQHLQVTVNTTPQASSSVFHLWSSVACDWMSRLDGGLTSGIVGSM